MNELNGKILALVLLLLTFGFLNLAEAAMTALSDTWLEKEKEQSRRAARVARILDKPGRFTSVVRNDRVILCVIMGGIAFSAFTLPLGEQFSSWGLAAPWSGAAAAVLTGFALCFLLLLLGAVARHIGGRFPEPVSLSSAPLVSLIFALTGWFGSLTAACSHGLCRLFRMDPSSDEERVTEEEIRLMVDAGEERGVIDESEKFMIDNVFEFGDRTVGDIMTHRTDIAAISIDASLREILDFVSAEKYSRFPVYRETLDDIVGTIHVKDLMPYALANAPDSFDLRKILHPPFIVPETKKADELFRELKRSKKYIAIVIDEYGGTAGLCTMEDLMESIVGSIFDEYDQEESEPIQRIGEDWLIDGSVSLEDAGEEIGLNFQDDEDLGDCDTLSGFICLKIGRIPDPQERPVVEYRGFRFAVTGVEGRRIVQVHISALPAGQDGGDDAGKD